MFNLHRYILIISKINTPRFGRGPSSTCSTIPRPTFSTSSVGNNSNPQPAQPPLQRPGSAAPHLQVGILPEAILKVVKTRLKLILMSCLQMIHGPPQALRTSDLVDGRRSDLVDGLRNHFDPMSQSQISESNTGTHTDTLTSTTLLKRFEILSLFFRSHF